MSYKLFLFFGLLWLFPVDMLADDPGITKVRLIQVSDTSYVLEADISQQLIWTIKTPVFPSRFQADPIEYEDKKGWVQIRINFYSLGEGLNESDQILLPWLRNGVDLTARFSNGEIKKELFMRSLDGIRIDMSRLIQQETTKQELFTDFFKKGIRHSYAFGIHILLALILALLSKGDWLLKGLTCFVIGQGIALIASDLGLTGFDSIFSDLLVLGLILLASVYLAMKERSKALFYLIGFLGITHGLGISSELELFDLVQSEALMAQYGFAIGLDAAMLGYSFVFGLLLRLRKSKRWMAYLTGSLSVFLMVLIFDSLETKQDLMALRPLGDVPTKPIELPAPISSDPAGTPIGVRELSTPIMNFISVEPYEIRQEILVEAKTALQVLDADLSASSIIPIQSLEYIKKGILDSIVGNVNLQVDRREVVPTIVRSDFATIGPAGVSIRETDQEESVQDGILAISLVYRTPDLADELLLNWKLFPEENSRIETTFSDQFGGEVKMISKSNRELNWKKKMTGYVVPAIDPVAFVKPRVPLISVILLLIGIVLLFTSLRLKTNLSIILLLMGFAIYPFQGLRLEISTYPTWSPDRQESRKILEKLLTNIYRSFDLREEEAIYDRLALSVEGDLLTEIYLQNTRALELENRGGARARVDELEISEVSRVVKNDTGDYSAEVSWLVGGSVSHFGHTHYRRNFNRGIITFAIKDGIWKVKNIEILNEKRLI